MKTKKALNWQNISEGILTVKEIICIQESKTPITMILSDASNTKTATVQIVSIRGPFYNILNQGIKINPKPYKYLSCAVRRAVKETKKLTRSGQWKILTKV